MADFKPRFESLGGAFDTKMQETQTFNAEMGVVNTVTSGGTLPRIGEVSLLASAWEGEGNRWAQVVEIDGVTERTQVDLTPSVEQLAIFYDKSLAFVAENEDGVVTVYAIGQKPAHDYVMQVTMMEVAV